MRRSVQFTQCFKPISNILVHIKSGVGVCLLLLLCGFVQAESYHGPTSRISVDHGLPDSTVYSIAKDKTGFLWFGMPTALSRFDGYQFRTFNKEKSQGKSLVLDGAGTLFIDSRHRLWVGSWGEGLSLYDQNMSLIAYFKHDPANDKSLGSDMIQTVFEDSQGDIWIGTNGGGLALYQEQTQSFISYRFSRVDRNSLSHDRVWSIVETAKGVLWIATSDGLNKLDKKVPGRFNRYKHNPLVASSLNHVLVRSLLTSKNGDLWVGTEAGFGHFDTSSKQFEEIRLTAGSKDEAVTRMVEDDKGGIWIGTKRGVYRYDPSTRALSPLDISGELRLFRHNDIRDMLIDDSGVLWLATRHAGLLKINLTPNRFSYYQHYLDEAKRANTINKVYALEAGKNDTLWMGIGEGLLHMDIKSKKISRIDPPEQFAPLRIRALAEAPSGKLWLGGAFGLLSYDPVSKSFNDETAVLANIGIKLVQSLWLDSKGSLWIGTAHSGLLHYDIEGGGKISHYQHDATDPDSLGSNAVFTLFEDRQGNLWIGTRGAGVKRFDAKKQRFIHYRADSRQPGSLSDNMVNVIYQTNDDQMWFGTPKSLDRFDQSLGQFIHYGVKDGMDNSNIKGIVEDDFGELWVSTALGLSQFKPREQQFINFSEQDNLQNNQFLHNSVGKSEGGQLFFGGNGGMHEVIPSEVKVNKLTPKVVITDIWVDDKRVDQLAFSTSQPLQLNHQIKNLRFRFTALDFQSPDKTRYAFQLKGFDEMPQGPSESRMVTYSNLEPGIYSFGVTGSNNTNQWQSNSAELPIIIVQPWWTLWWFKLIMVFVLFCLLYSWNRFRLITIDGQKKLLEVEVALRTAEINLQKDELIEDHQQLNERAKLLEVRNKELSLSLQKTSDYQDQLIEEQKMAALASMVTGISHEINTPIGLGITATTLMQDRMVILKEAFGEQKLSAKQLSSYLNEGEESLEIIFRNLEKAAEMIRSFKQVSVDKSREESRTFSMLNLINEVLFSLQSDLKAVRHQVEVICDDTIRVRCKPGPLNQILINLITNSLAHAFEGIEKGLMSVKVTLSGNHCQVTYKDNGVGISGDLEEHIFEPFVAGKGGSGGTGLGMHLVYNLVTQGLGGSISLNRGVEQGIELTLIFPVTIAKEIPRTQESLLI